MVVLFEKYNKLLVTSTITLVVPPEIGKEDRQENRILVCCQGVDIHDYIIHTQLEVFYLFAVLRSLV